MTKFLSYDQFEGRVQVHQKWLDENAGWVTLSGHGIVINVDDHEFYVVVVGSHYHVTHSVSDQVSFVHGEFSTRSTPEKELNAVIARFWGE